MQPQMNADERRLDLNGISQKVIRCAYSVANTLGAGFLCINVEYDGICVGEFAADLIVEGCVLVELKTVKSFDDIHFAQCMNYLRATGFRVCLLINFGASKLQIKRLVHRF